MANSAANKGRIVTDRAGGAQCAAAARGYKFTVLDWILTHNGFIIEAAILGLIVLYVGLKIK
ncbi:MAG: hypothetical protein ACPHXW_00715 [Marinobacterium sp.]